MKVKRNGQLKSNRTNRKSHQERSRARPSSGEQGSWRSGSVGMPVLTKCQSQANKTEDAKDVDEEEVATSNLIESI